jgi:hypothetical protein
MSEGETLMLTMVESLLDRKLGDIMAKVMLPAVADQFDGLRAEIASLKQEFVATAAANRQKQDACQASIEALASKLPGSHPSTQNSGTTLSAAAEFRPQPMPDAGYASYMYPPHPDFDAFGFLDEHSPYFIAGDAWSHQAAAEENSPSATSRRSTTSMQLKPDPQDGYARSAAWVMQQPNINLEPLQAMWPPNPQQTLCQSDDQQASGSSAAKGPPAPHILADRSSPALHRKHNPKSCMLCRGSFKKLSGCKEHMLKCVTTSSGCRFMPNFELHQQMIRPFTGPDVETRWGDAVSEWIHRKE